MKLIAPACNGRLLGFPLLVCATGIDQIGHLSFKALRLMAAVVCKCGNITKRPWHMERGKTKKTLANFARECVSVDHLKSPESGFLARFKGKLTTVRYIRVTIFVDH